MVKKKQDRNPFSNDANHHHFLEEPLFLKIARGVGQAMTAQIYSPEDLIIHSYNKIVQMNAVLEKEKSFFGRIYNKIAGEDIISIALDGIVIQQLHDVVGIKPPILIEIQYQYNIEHNELRDLFAKAQKIIEKKRPKTKSH
ncbi:hypothetical protein [Kiloniella antarctica]|uniref:Uncharacterized protein n=1 Tax=Kiloniella antarctica TaxID=1550907 RepID=A0ABW5BJT5_9PROT